VGGVKKQFFLSMFSFCYIPCIVDNAADILVLREVSNNTLEMEPSSGCMSQPTFDYRILGRPHRSRSCAHRLSEIVRM
jgi:hypothetical protein